LENRQGEILLVNASAYCVKVGAKNRLTDAGIKAVAEVYRNWETREKLSRVVTKKDVQEADYNLSPSQFVEINDKVTHRPISEILRDLEVARSEKEKVDKDLAEVLATLDLNGD
jgi:type I restriction enzyme M protein